MIAPLGAAGLAERGNTSISELELTVELEAMPDGVRDNFKRSPESAVNLTQDLLTRRLLADRARAEGINHEPGVEARLRLTADRVLYETYLERAEAEKISEDVLLALAFDEYRANPEKFRTREEIHARHILLCACADDPGARERGEAVLARLKAGESFEALATELSTDKGSASRGGDLGFFARGKMVKPFEDAAFALTTPGELSALVETEFGLHIIRLEERKESSRMSFDEVKQVLVEEARKKARSRVRSEIVAPLREPPTEIDAEEVRKVLSRIR